jgi:hypothetical protein
VALLIVVLLLTLFAIVALAFMLYSESQSTSSRIYREAQNKGDIKPEEVLAFALGQLIYGVDPEHPATQNVNSAMQSHDLGRTMYDYRPRNAAAPAVNAGGDPNIYPFTSNTGHIYPYNGAGRPHYTYAAAGGSVFTGNDDYVMPNYQFFSADAATTPQRRAGWINTGSLASPQPVFVGGGNPNYTYPDLNSMFLAAVRSDGTVLAGSFDRGTLTGFGSLDPANPNWYSNSDLTMKYRTLRPRPIDQLFAGETLTQVNGQWVAYNPLTQATRSIIQPPVDAGGDVKNLRDSPGGMDSSWMDLGFPARTVGGRLVKPMFAFLVDTLDNRLNLNAHGNVRRPGTAPNPGTAPPGQPPWPPSPPWTPWMTPQPLVPGHASNQGWSRSEVNLGKLLTGVTRDATVDNFFPSDPNPPAPPPGPPHAFVQQTEWQYLFTKNSGRYGSATITSPPPSYNFPQPAPTTSVSNTESGDFPRFYAQVDFDGMNESAPQVGPAGTESTPYQLPGQGGVPSSYAFGYFNPAGGYGNGSVAERTNIPLSYNYFSPEGLTLTGERDRRFNVQNMRYLLNPGRGINPGSVAASAPDYLLSELYGVIPQNLGDPSNTNLTYNTQQNQDYRARLRRLITTLSMDVDRAGLPPWAWNFDAAGTPYVLTVPVTSPPTPPSAAYPVGNAVNYPSPALPAGTPGSAYSAAGGGMKYLPPPTTIFQVTLPGPTPIPAQFQTLQPTSRVDLNRPLPPYPINPSATMRSIDMTAGTQSQLQYQLADAARQQMTMEIFQRLLLATTGTGDLNDITVVNPAYLPPGTPAATAAQATVGVNTITAAKMADPFIGPTMTAMHNAHRWLAQLAVNVVDYIDADDVITTFAWYRPGDDASSPVVFPGQVAGNAHLEWVYGTELPRLLINEVYADISNSYNASLTPPTAQFTASPPITPPYLTNYQYNYWVELHNPLNSTANPNLYDPANPPDMTTNPPTQNLVREGAYLQIPDPTYAGPNGAIYQIVITDPSLNLGATPINDLTNPKGDPDPTTVVLRMADFSDTNLDAPATASTLAAGERQIVRPVDGNLRGADKGNVGFYLVGPALNFPGMPDPGTKPNATYRPTGATGPTTQPPYAPAPVPSLLSRSAPSAGLAPTTPPPVNILLRRLANPYLPYNDFAAAGSTTLSNPLLPYNPYVTVDYVENIPHQQDQQWNAPFPGVLPPGRDASLNHTIGKRQPYVSGRFNATIGGPPHQLNGLPTPVAGQWQPQQLPGLALNQMPQHTFFNHNIVGAAISGSPPPTMPAAPGDATIKSPFDWLSFMDRQLSSPIELLHLPAVGPAQLTQRFVTGDPSTFMGGIPEAYQQHTANWLDRPDPNFVTWPTTAGTTLQSSRLSRALEFLNTRDRSAGMSAGGRVPGRLNLNTFWDDPATILADIVPPQVSMGVYGSPLNAGYPGYSMAVFQALCDAQTSNHFYNTNTIVANGSVDPEYYVKLLFAQSLVSRTVHATGVPNGVPATPGVGSFILPGAVNFARPDRPFRGYGVPVTVGDHPLFPGYGQFPWGSYGVPPLFFDFAHRPNSYTAPDRTDYTAPPPPGTTTYDGPTRPWNNGAGVEDTLMRSGVFVTPPATAPPTSPSSNPLFGLATRQPTATDPHPYVADELLRKISDSTTTRSNTFAVYLTVGFFEVDPTSYAAGENPVKLGKEVGSDTGTQKRMRFFSIIDRTNLSIDPTASSPFPAPGQPFPTGGFSATVPTAPTALRQGPKPFFLPFSPVKIEKYGAATIGIGGVAHALNDIKVTPQRYVPAGQVTVTLPPVDLETPVPGFPPGTGYPNRTFGAPDPSNPPNQANTPILPFQGGTTGFPGGLAGIPNPAQTQAPMAAQVVQGAYEGILWQTYVYDVNRTPNTPYGVPVLTSGQPTAGIVGTPTGVTIIPPDNLPTGTPLPPPTPPVPPNPPPPVSGPPSPNWNFPVLRSMLLIDDGERQEMVFVEKVETTIITSNGVNVLVPTLTFTTIRPHYAGCTISNVPLGNPGPQGPIDWTLDSYRSVVPLAAILE